MVTTLGFPAAATGMPAPTQVVVPSVVELGLLTGFKAPAPRPLKLLWVLLDAAPRAAACAACMAWSACSVRDSDCIVCWVAVAACWADEIDEAPAFVTAETDAPPPSCRACAGSPISTSKLAPVSATERSRRNGAATVQPSSATRLPDGKRRDGSIHVFGSFLREWIGDMGGSLVLASVARHPAFADAPP